MHARRNYVCGFTAKSPAFPAGMIRPGVSLDLLEATTSAQRSRMRDADSNSSCLLGITAV
jgi:hypothetical protein